MTNAQRIAALQALLARAKAADAWVKAHPGAIRALGAFLSPLAAMHMAWAIDAKKLLDDLPGVCAEAETYLPEAIFVLQEFEPAATGIVGG